MTAIDPVGTRPPPRPAARTAAGPAFAPPAETAAGAPAPAGMVAPPVALDALLALQQVDAAPEQDRAAHRRGQALLAVLARLQRSILGGGDAAAILQEMQSLTNDVPLAADPALAAAVDQVVLRARIELERRQNPALR